MTDLDAVAHLSNAHRAELGFIPWPKFVAVYAPRNQLIYQRDRHGTVIGYLLHGNLCPAQPARIYQVCIDYDHRHLLHATRAVHELYTRCRTAGCTSIGFWCLASLPANAFWHALGGQIVDSGVRNSKTRAFLLEYRLSIPPPGPSLWITPQLTLRAPNAQVQSIQDLPPRTPASLLRPAHVVPQT